MTLPDFEKLKKDLKKDFSGLKKVRLALLGDSSTQLLDQAIKGYGRELDLDLQIFEADYDQIDLQVFNADSELYKQEHDFVILFYSSQKLWKKFCRQDQEQRPNFSDGIFADIQKTCSLLRKKTRAKIILFNFAEINDSTFGHFANKTPYSFLYQVRKLNVRLMELAQQQDGLYLFDLQSAQQLQGSAAGHDRRFYISADSIISFDLLPKVAKEITDIIRAADGHFKKCVILDLDNTLWGGIIGDDGINAIEIGELGIGKAFSELQLWLKLLKERGLILCVCSKNDEKTAKEPFQNHPDMVLRLDDIAIFTANWDNKADNIRHIQKVLNIGFDSMVFIDDNPAERALVKQYLPEITVPEMPEDPAEYLPFLQSLNLFETVSFTQNDSERTQQYQESAQRTDHEKQFVDKDEFLKNLQMSSAVRSIDAFTLPRAAQLIQRSNQFNLRTIRRSESDLTRIMNSNTFFTRTFTLIDKFGDNGLISLIILEKKAASLFIDTWIMSCRVLSREVEHIVLNEIVRIARSLKISTVIGEYIPTAKNGLVKEHYANLGFSARNAQWELNVRTYQDKNHHICIIEEAKAKA